MTLRRLLGSPLVALLSLTLLAVWPIVRAGYPSIGDGLNHFYRLVEFDHLLRHGAWFPRWATDLAYGYGYPVFHFYPPLVYYLGALFHALGLSFANSLLAIYVCAWALATIGAYALAHERWGELGGLIAAGAYGFAPYLYFNALARGALPETWGLGLLPWVLYAYARLARRPGTASFASATLLYAILILSHLLSALLAAPLIALVVFISITQSPTAPSRTAFRLRSIPLGHSRTSRLALASVASLFLSLSLSAFFLLPATLETRAVQIYQLTTPGDLDFRNNFLTLPQLLAWPQPFDPRLVFVSVPSSLSLAALALAAIGLAFNLRHPPFGIWSLGFGVSFLSLCLLTLPLTLPLWERLPIGGLVQFPWRLVGPASLLLALLAASLSPRLGHWGLVIGTFLLFLYSLPWTFAPVFHTPTAPTVRDIHSYEAETGQLGTTSTGEFLPRDVQELPAPDSLRTHYAAKPVIDRLAGLPAGVALISQSATLTSATATVDAQSPAHLTFNIFFFPGWRATVDGQPAPIEASTPQGLITVPVESGQHTVAIHFGLTPLRTMAIGLSGTALSVLLALLVRSGVTDKWRFETRGQELKTSPATLHPHIPALLITLAALALLLVRAIAIDGRDTLFRRSRFDGATVSGAGQALDVNFDNQLVLIGLDLPRTTIKADAPLQLTLYWRAQNLLVTDYSSTVQVLDASNNLFGQSDSQHPGRAPTSRWGLDQYARDAHTLHLFPGTPPGTYRLMVGVYPFDGASLNVLDENQIPQGQAYQLGTLMVTRAARPPAQIDAAQPLDLALGPLALTGETLNTTSPQAGDELRLTLFWRATQSPMTHYQLLLELTTLNDRVIHSLTTSPARADYPTSAWTQGEVVRAPFHFRIPASAPAGPAALRASLLTPEGIRVSGPVELARLDLRAPERSFAIPPIAHPRGDEFGGQIKLLGYDLTSSGITLYWQALAEMDVSYTVFVHALDSSDHILAQVDALPLSGARPTTGWLPGEVLADPYPLSLAGAAKIEIGLYNAQSGERLGTVALVPQTPRSVPNSN
ncbi:MAG: 6-pyruvoyl-tetrahydropterin synthase-related protein [Anaerolineales bacterium]